jgi:ribosomal 50S subunit-associated protein YjgA (DUF615 family)
MRLIIKSSANRYRENLLTSNKVIAIILDEYTDASRRDLVLIVRKAGRERPQIRTVNVTHATYMPLYYVLLFLYGDPS